MEQIQIKNIGLRGVTVADTKISYIDGRQGVLLYRGYRIEDLAARSSFEETAFLLLNGCLPKEHELSWFTEELASARQIPDSICRVFHVWPRDANPMDILQASVPLLATVDTELHDETREANVRKAIRLLARLASIMASWHRIRTGLEPVTPSKRLPHAADFLWRLTGEEPPEDVAHDLDVGFILQAEHTFNASSFACRVVASTGAHMYAGVAAGVGALSGELHGGANARVVEMLLGLDGKEMKEENVHDWVSTRMDKRKRIMGMGHAVYKTFDPRAQILKRIAERLANKTGYAERYRLLAKIEEESVKQFERRGKHQIKANVDFYSGLVFSMMGIPLDLMTPMFALSILAGWCAHIIEEKFAEAQDKSALYSPEADYIGDYCGPLGCRYQAIEAR